MLATTPQKQNEASIFCSFGLMVPDEAELNYGPRPSSFVW